MYKETGRLNVSVAGIVSEVNTKVDMPYIIVDDEKIFIKHSSTSLLNKIEFGGYTKLACYLECGKLYATNLG